MFIVVVIDGTEFEGVAAENLGDVAVDGVIDVEIAVGTECVDGGAARIGECTAGKRQARNTANNVGERQCAADSRLDMGRLRKVHSPNDVDDERRRRCVDSANAVLVSGRICRSRQNSRNRKGSEETALFESGIAVMQKLSV